MIIIRVVVQCDNISEQSNCTIFQTMAKWPQRIPQTRRPPLPRWMEADPVPAIRRIFNVVR